MVQLILPALVTLLGTIVTTRTWPTLSRRVRDHTALLKDMPADVGDPLKELLRLEVVELVNRDRPRLNRRQSRVSNAVRAFLAVGTIGAAALITAFLVHLAETTTPYDWLPILVIGICVLVALIVLGMALYALRNPVMFHTGPAEPARPDGPAQT